MKSSVRAKALIFESAFVAQFESVFDALFESLSSQHYYRSPDDLFVVIGKLVYVLHRGMKAFFCFAGTLMQLEHIHTASFVTVVFL